jgi:hypothetical protein
MALHMKKIILLTLLFAIGGGLFLYVKNGGLRLKPKKKIYSQLTDNEAFRHFCRKALASPEIFASFKQDPIYTLFYENVSEAQGKALYSYLEREAPHLLQPQQIEKFQTEDQIGTPTTYVYPSIGSFSPSTLRAIQVAHDLEQHFGNLNGKKVVEIGAGHASLCKILIDLFPEIDYTIVDLPEALQLAQKTLQALGIHKVRFLTTGELQKEQIDLLISNYTFTESGSALQRHYFDTLVRQAGAGYLTCNFFAKHFRVRPWNRRQLLQKFQSLPSSIEILPEFLQTGPENFVLIWNDRPLA